MKQKRSASLEETLALYTLLREALPLARQTLLRGGVELLNQQAFWTAYSGAQTFADLDDEEQLNAICGD